MTFQKWINSFLPNPCKQWLSWLDIHDIFWNYVSEHICEITIVGHFLCEPGLSICLVSSLPSSVLEQTPLGQLAWYFYSWMPFLLPNQQCQRTDPNSKSYYQHPRMIKRYTNEVLEHDNWLVPSLMLCLTQQSCPAVEDQDQTHLSADHSPNTTVHNKCANTYRLFRMCIRVQIHITF